MRVWTLLHPASLGSHSHITGILVMQYKRKLVMTKKNCESSLVATNEGQVHVANKEYENTSGKSWWDLKVQMNE